MPALREPELQVNDSQILDTTTLLNAMSALRRGDFTARLPAEWTGVAGKVADTFNQVVELNERMAAELERLSRVVGKEGRIQERLSVIQATGAWSERVNSVNNLIDCLAHPVSETAHATSAADITISERRNAVTSSCHRDVA